MDEQTVAQDDDQSVIQEEVVEQEAQEVDSDDQQDINKEEVVSAPAEGEEEQQEDGVEEEEAPTLTNRQMKRINQIEQKAEELKLNKILDRIQGIKSTPRQEHKSQPKDYREMIDAPDEVYETLNQDRESYGDQKYNEGLQVANAIEWKTNMRMDLPLVKEKLDNLDPADAEAIDREYLIFSGFDPNTGFINNPNIGYADFVEARIQQAERLASSMNLKSQKNIARQAAQTGVRPDGGAHKGLQISSPDDIRSMTPEQFEKNRAAIYKAAGLTYKP